MSLRWMLMAGLLALLVVAGTAGFAGASCFPDCLPPLTPP